MNTVTKLTVHHTMTKSFEEYLADVHAEDYMGTDDEMPDAFDEFLASLGYEDTMQHWRVYSHQNPVCPLCTDILEHREKKSEDKPGQHSTHAYVCPSCPFLGVEYYFDKNLTELKDLIK